MPKTNDPKNLEDAAEPDSWPTTRRALLPLRCVRLQALDENRELMKGHTASGFVRREGSAIFLYTCWHFVTQLDPFELRVTSLPRRRYLRVDAQDARGSRPGSISIGGLQTIDVPLYDTSTNPHRPMWLQDDQHVPNADLNAIGIYVPFWHDVIKIELPTSFRASDIQVIDESELHGRTNMVVPGDKCLVVGYPYGYSSHGLDQPTPIVLTRFIASLNMKGRVRGVLLDSIGAPGMSGGPIYVENGAELRLFGIYTGSVYPHAELLASLAGKNQGEETHDVYSKNRATDLGVACDISFVLWGHMKMANVPSQPVPRT